MSEAAAKATRREIRRALGPSAVAAIAETQDNISALAPSLSQAHQRIDLHEAELLRLRGDSARFAKQVESLETEQRRCQRIADLAIRTLWTHLRFLVLGR